MLKSEKTCLAIVDVQVKLADLMYEKMLLFDHLQKIIKGVQVLNIPVLWAEQNPEGMGPTIVEVAALLSDIKPMAKMSFSCCGSKDFMDALKATGCSQVLIAGIETHVCVYQTAVGLLESGYEAHVVVDAVSSRTKENKTLGLQKMMDAGVLTTSTEMALFELIRVAGSDAFRKVLQIVK